MGRQHWTCRGATGNSASPGERVVAAVEKMAALEQAGADAARLGALYVDAFIRLMNDGDFAQAQQLAAGEGVERRLRHCTAPARQNALIALLLLELQPGGTAARVPGEMRQQIEK